MTLGDLDEEGLPLLEHGRGSGVGLSRGYRSILHGNQNRGWTGSDVRRNPYDGVERGVHSIGSHPSVSASNLRITYTWEKLNVYGSSNGREAGSVWKRIRRWSRRSDEIPGYNVQKHILKNAYGIAHPGEILAVMGPSGAGKTTLLNALTFQSPADNTVRGFRYLNGRQVRRRATVTSRSAYVEQNTLFLGNLTVREHLVFQALIRMDRTLSYRQKVKRVDDVMTEVMGRHYFRVEQVPKIQLGLDRCKDTRIGHPGRTTGISGGEMRRLAFASEVLTNPPLLFCDEPTSGLDSFMALNVINVLKAMAAGGKTVVFTVHQPSSEMLSLFDKVLLISEGRTAFLGRPDDAAKFFADLGAAPLLYHNVSDTVMGVLSVVPRHENTSRETINFVCDCFDQSTLGLELVRDIESMGKQPGDDSWTFRRSNDSVRQYQATWCTQFRVLYWRSWLTVIKEPLLVKMRLFQTVVLSLIVGVIYHGQRLDEAGVMNINGVLFTFLTNMTFQNLFAVINIFCGELPIFTREHKKRLYRVDTYFLSKVLAELPLFVLIPFIFTAVTYHWIGLKSNLENFLTAVVVLTLVTNVATSFGCLISCASSNVTMALSVGPPVIIPFLLFGGYLLNAGAIPNYMKWLSYFSWFKYGNEALLINQWADVDAIDCSNSNGTCPANGDIVLEMYNFQKGNFLWDVASLGLLIVLFRFLAYLALVIRTSIGQKSFSN